ncbi:hypothetical protein YC2023_104801 [Brassica napus]
MGALATIMNALASPLLGFPLVLMSIACMHSYVMAEDEEKDLGRQMIVTLMLKRTTHTPSPVYMETRRSQPHGSLALLHADPVELLYYWFYRARHDSTTTSSTLATILTTTPSSIVSRAHNVYEFPDNYRKSYMQGEKIKEINSYNHFTRYYFKWALNTHGIPNEGVSRVYAPQQTLAGAIRASATAVHVGSLALILSLGLRGESHHCGCSNVNDPEWLLVAEASITSYCLTWLICILDRKLTDFHYTN